MKLWVQLLADGTVEAVMGDLLRVFIWTMPEMLVSRHTAALGRADSAPVDMEGQAESAARADRVEEEVMADTAAREAVAALKPMPELR